MNAAEKYELPISMAKVPQSSASKQPSSKQLPISEILVGLAGVCFIAWLVSYNLKHVPRSEVTRIYQNAGTAVKRSFKLNY